MKDIVVSLVLCTHNPRPEFLATCLSSVASQDLPRELFEFIVVDNNCDPPLDKDQLRRLASRDVQLVRERRPGLAFARVAGFETAQCDLIVFIDDDNEFSPDYLRNVVRIAEAEPDLGVFGGKCIGVLEQAVSRIKEQFLPFLGVRDVGDLPLTGDGDTWGPYEPIGAGIVVRRAVANLYTRYLTLCPTGGALGRSGNQLLAGEDSLISRLAHLSGLSCGYRPELKLRHHIEGRRTTWKYLFRLMHGHGISFVRLGRICGENFSPVTQDIERKMIRKNFLYRLCQQGPVQALMHLYWDRGYYEAVNESQTPNARTLSEILGVNLPKCSEKAVTQPRAARD